MGPVKVQISSIRIDTETCISKFPLEPKVKRSINSRGESSKSGCVSQVLEKYKIVEEIERKFEEKKLFRLDKNRDFVI